MIHSPETWQSLSVFARYFLLKTQMGRSPLDVPEQSSPTPMNFRSKCHLAVLVQLFSQLFVVMTKVVHTSHVLKLGSIAEVQDLNNRIGPLGATSIIKRSTFLSLVPSIEELLFVRRMKNTQTERCVYPSEPYIQGPRILIFHSRRTQDSKTSNSNFGPRKVPS